MIPFTVISGGQTGVDRAALDVAIEKFIPYGGWCPRGGWAEDLLEPPGLLARYPLLKETPLADPAQRTDWNVRDADAVLILSATGGVAASHGTALARERAGRYGKPLLLLGLDDADAAGRARGWLDECAERWRPAGAAVPRRFALGIGGPRESEATGIYRRATEFLREVL
jgi:hypothetical protein